MCDRAIDAILTSIEQAIEFGGAPALQKLSHNIQPKIITHTSLGVSEYNHSIMDPKTLSIIVKAPLMVIN